jgi:hypothetical protein
LRWLLLAASLGGSLGVLVNWWTAVWPNLEASWFQGSVIAAVAAPAGAWYGRWLDKHHSGHHADTRAHITAELAPLQQSLDALHAKIDQRGGGQ